MKIIDEFKEFALKGNVVDLAVGVIIGGAFGKIVSSLVSDVVMPPIGLLLGGVNFTSLKVILKPEYVAANGKLIEPVAINYGVFIQTTVDFIIVSFIIFLAVKFMNKLRKPKESPVPPQEQLLTEIRDLLKDKKS